MGVCEMTKTHSTGVSHSLVHFTVISHTPMRSRYNIAYIHACFLTQSTHHMVIESILPIPFLSLFSCDQAALRTLLTVHPSVCHTFFTMFPSLYHHEIFRSDYQWQTWYPCKRSRSKVKVTEVKTQLSCFRTVTPVWIHGSLWNDARSLE